MPAYEYSVIPAPSRGEKARGAKTGAERFALSLTATLNDMAADGWEYVRAETLPSEERAGLTGRTTIYHNVLVFRRLLTAEELPVPPAYAQPVPAAYQPPEEARNDQPADTPTRPFSEPMRAKPLAAPVETSRSRPAEPPLTMQAVPTGPRLGPANR